MAENEDLHINKVTRARLYYGLLKDSFAITWSLFVVYEIDATAEFLNTSEAPTITKDINYYYVLEYRSVIIEPKQTVAFEKVDTWINRRSSHAGASFVCWEVDGKLFNEPPEKYSPTNVHHSFYTDGFESLEKVEQAIKDEAKDIEMKQY